MEPITDRIDGWIRRTPDRAAQGKAADMAPPAARAGDAACRAVPLTAAGGGRALWEGREPEFRGR